MGMEEKPWKVVNRRRMKENQQQQQQQQQQLRRPWDALPADYYSLQFYPPSSYGKFYYYRNGYEDYYPLLIRGGKWDGVSRFRTLLRKSSSSAAASSSSSTTTTTITSLYLTPFTFSYPNNEESLDQDEILHLIANCCPNLKHISFDGFPDASKEAMFEVFYRCNKLELIDFSESLGSADADSLIEVIQQLGNNLPLLRGIRILGGWEEQHTSIIATHLPRIKLLDMECDAFEVPRLLLSSETQLLELQYLRVGVYFRSNQLPPPVHTTHIPEFHYEDIEYLFDWYDICQCRPRHRQFRPRLYPGGRHPLMCLNCITNEEEEKEEKREEDIHTEYSSHPDPQDHSILKQKKEDKYYLSIFKENNKTRNHHRHRHALMRRRGLMKKKNNKEASLKIMKTKKRDDNHMLYGYNAEDYMYLVH